MKQPETPRIAVTDVGMVSAAGVGVDAGWSHVTEGISCIGPVRSFDASAYDVALGADLSEVPQAGRADDERSIHLLLAAADDLTTGLGGHLSNDAAAARRTAVVLGTSKGAVLGMAAIHRRLGDGLASLSDAELSSIRNYRPGYGASRLAEHLGARGPRTTVGIACASGALAILHAAELIRQGLVDRAIAGGFDGFSPFIFAGFHSIGALTQTQCRPFDRRRDGTALGEGAGLVVLEAERAAEERGVRPLALYEGGGYAGDGVHLTAPDREGRGLARAVQQAFDDASVTPEGVDYINGHGTGTVYNDLMECRAFATIFGETAESVPPPISSTKSVFGHTLGAAGALDAIMSIMALQQQLLPPTVNGGEEPEVEGWDFVPGLTRPVVDLDRVLTTNSGFAGNNTALIFSRWPDDAGPLLRPASGAVSGGVVAASSPSGPWLDR